MGAERREKKGMLKRRSRLRAIQGLYILSQNRKLEWDELSTDMKNGWFAEKECLEDTEKECAALEALPCDEDLLRDIIEGSRSNFELAAEFLEDNLLRSESINRVPLLLRCIVQAAIYELEGLQGEDERRIIVADYVAVAGSFFGKKETSLLNGLLSKMMV